MLEKLLDTFNLIKLGKNIYEGENLDIGSPQVYGGHVVAQALIAAGKTVKLNKRLHSLHSYFLAPGNNLKKIQYEVEELKTGRSFDVRRVYAKQGEKVIFLLAASYHIHEEGVEHQAQMPNILKPEKLSSFPEIFSEFAEKFNIKPRGIFSENSPILFHPVDHYDPINPGIRPGKMATWFKANGDIPTDDLTHLALMAYTSDFNLLITSLLPHGISLFKTPMRVASLDHAMWFHRKPRIDDWMLYTVDSPNSANARGFCQGKIWDREGNLIVSVAQEGLIRPLS